MILILITRIKIYDDIMEERDSMPISDEKCVQNLVISLNGRDNFGDQECT